MAVDLPCPVLIRIGAGSSIIQTRERLGLLLEWKQVRDDRGVASWVGLVVYALPAVGRAGSWELSLRWMGPEWLTPLLGRS